MTEFAKQIKPFSSLQSCGDFAFYIECANSTLICVGDIGGHGNQIIGDLAKEIEKFVRQNKESSIYHIFEKICEIKSVKEFGLVLFIGRIEKQLPLMHYICIGNLKLHKISDGFLKRLPYQNGIIGLELPVNIEKKIVKLKNDEIIVLCTDGVSNYEHEIEKIIKTSNDLQSVADTLIDRFAVKEDDALCLLMKYFESSYIERNTKKTSLQPEQSPIELLSNISEPVQLPAQRTTQIKEESLPQQAVEPLSQEYLFASIYNSKIVRNKIETLVDFFEFDTLMQTKLKTVLLELIYKNGHIINVYVNPPYCQIQTKLEESFVKTVFPIFPQASKSYEKEQQHFILQLRFSKTFNLHSDTVKDFKEMLKFGVDQESYTRFKKDKEKDEIISQQSKLAAMGEMIGAIAHQWRQPLNELAIRVQKLKYAFNHDAITEEYVHKFIKNNMETIQFMSSTIDDFRNFFRIDKTKKLFDIKEAIEKTMNLQRAQLLNNDIELKISGDTFSVFGYENEFQQVILNIISNAKDAFVHNKTKNRSIQIKIQHPLIKITDNAGGRCAQKGIRTILYYQRTR